MKAGNRGVNQSNPNHGRLAKALAKKSSDNYGPTPTDLQRDKDLVVSSASIPTSSLVYLFLGAVGLDKFLNFIELPILPLRFPIAT